jgi:hypothetical protein
MCDTFRNVVVLLRNVAQKERQIKTERRDDSRSLIMGLIAIMRRRRNVLNEILVEEYPLVALANTLLKAGDHSVEIKEGGAGRYRSERNAGV